MGVGVPARRTAQIKPEIEWATDQAERRRGASRPTPSGARGARIKELRGESERGLRSEEEFPKFSDWTPHPTAAAKPAMAPSRAGIQTAFRLHGFSLRADAARRLEALLAPLGADEAEAWTQRILEALQGTPLESAVVSRDLVDRVVRVSVPAAPGGGHVGD